MAKLIRIDRKLRRVGRKLVTDAGGAPCCCGGGGGECCDMPGAVCGWDTSPQGLEHKVRMSVQWNFTLTITGYSPRNYSGSVAEADIVPDSPGSCRLNYSIKRGPSFGNHIYFFATLNLDPAIAVNMDPLAECDCNVNPSRTGQGVDIYLSTQIVTDDNSYGDAVEFAYMGMADGSFEASNRSPCLPENPDGCNISGSNSVSITRTGCGLIRWTQTVTNYRFPEANFKTGTINGSASGVFNPAYVGACAGARPGGGEILDPAVLATLDLQARGGGCKGCGEGFGG